MDKKFLMSLKYPVWGKNLRLPIEFEDELFHLGWQQLGLQGRA